MSDEVLVKVEGVSKKYCRSLKRSMWYGVQDVTSEMLGRKGHHDELRKNEFWAVNDVSFELKRGECLGLIGPNGAGKSTLLKMLNGLIKPDKGRITMRGRIGALIELGAGFNPILTARENIYVNGAVLGFNKKEIDRKFDDIINFAEVGEFIDSPVQSYSSGMKVRLGFAIAAQMEPDVLLIDEVLAVGDAKFVFKCINKISALAKDCTVIIVSHSMPMIGRMSSSAMVLNGGIGSFFEYDVKGAIQSYHSTGQLVPTTSESSNYLHAKKVMVNGVDIQDANTPITVFFQQRFEVQICFEVIADFPRAFGNLVFMDMESKPVAQCWSIDTLVETGNDPAQVVIGVDFEKLPLNPGRYYLHFGLVESQLNNRLGQIIYQNSLLVSLQVLGGRPSWAPVQLLGDWSSKAL